VYTSNDASASDILCLTGAVLVASLLGAAARELSPPVATVVPAEVELDRWCRLFFRTR